MLGDLLIDGYHKFRRCSTHCVVTVKYAACVDLVQQAVNPAWSLLSFISVLIKFLCLCS